MLDSLIGQANELGQKVYVVLAYLYDNFNEVNIDFRVTGEEWRFSSNDEVAIFRLTQEALQNALKHAKSSNINVSIETFDGYTHHNKR